MPKATTKRRAETADNVFHQGALAAKMLREIAEATDAPYLKPVAGISLLILDAVQTVKENKEECTRMTKRTYELVCAIINIYQDSGADLSPAMIRSIGHFSETLEKILSFVRHQAAGSLIRRLVRHAENSSLLAECNTGLKHAHDVFIVESNIIVSVAISEIKRDADERHQELMKAISDREHSGHFSSVCIEPSGVVGFVSYCTSYRPLIAAAADLRAACFCDITKGDLHLRRREYDIAKSIFERCLMTTRVELDDDTELTLLCYERLSDTEHAMKNTLSALRYSVVLPIVGLRAQGWPAIHQALRCLGDVLLDESQEECAETLFNAALDGFTSMDVHRGRADCMIRVGDIWKGRSDVVKAAELWVAARSLFERSSQWSDIANCDSYRLQRTKSKHKILR